MRIGCAPDVSLQLLQAFLGALYGRGTVRAEVVHVRSAEQIVRLRAGELDLGLIHHGQTEPRIATEPLCPGEQLMALLPIGHRLALAPALGTDDFRHEVLLVPPRGSDPELNGWLLAALRNRGDRFSSAHELIGSDARDLVFAVADGLGIALAPRSMLRRIGEVGSIVTTRPLDPPLQMPETLVAWRADRLSISVREIARELRRGSEEPLSYRPGALPTRTR